jgi:small subunit ribosomal protein S2
VRAIALYCDLISRAALDGMATQMGESFDLGEMAEPPAEAVLDAGAMPAEPAAPVA